MYQLLTQYLKNSKKKTKRINPLKVSKLSIAQLKSCGLSRQKALGIKELSIKFVKKEFDPKIIKNMNDEEAIQYLSSLRQIGRWSAEMILLFTYNRSNIWPLQDIGLLRAISNNYKKKYFPPKSFLINFIKNLHLIVQLLLGISGAVLTMNQSNTKRLQSSDVDVLHSLQE